MIFLQFYMGACIFPETQVNSPHGSELGVWELAGWEGLPFHRKQIATAADQATR